MSSPAPAATAPKRQPGPVRCKPFTLTDEQVDAFYEALAEQIAEDAR